MLVLLAKSSMRITPNVSDVRMQLLSSLGANAMLFFQIVKDMLWTLLEIYSACNVILSSKRRQRGVSRMRQMLRTVYDGILLTMNVENATLSCTLKNLQVFVS